MLSLYPHLVYFRSPGVIEWESVAIRVGQMALQIKTHSIEMMKKMKWEVTRLFEPLQGKQKKIRKLFGSDRL